MPLSVAAEIVPSLVPLPLLNSTARPPLVNVFPAASRVVSVSVVPVPEAIEDAETATDDCASESAPGFTITVGAALVRAFPSTVAPSARAVPAVVPVNVAV